MDYSKVSDEELLKLVQNRDYSKVSDEELISLTERESEPGVLGKVGEFVGRRASEFGEVVRGVGEAATSTALGIPAWLGGTAAGLGTLALTAGDVGAAKAVQEGTAEQIATVGGLYEPKTDLGKNILENLTPVLSAPAEVGKELVDLPLESWKAPEVVRYPAEIAAEFAMYPAVIGSTKLAKGIVKRAFEERLAEVPKQKVYTEKEMGEPPVEIAPPKVFEDVPKPPPKAEPLQFGTREAEPVVIEPKVEPTPVTPKTEVPGERLQVIADSLKDELPTWQIERIGRLKDRTTTNDPYAVMKDHLSEGDIRRVQELQGTERFALTAEDKIFLRSIEKKLEAGLESDAAFVEEVGKRFQAKEAGTETGAVQAEGIIEPTSSRPPRERSKFDLDTGKNRVEQLVEESKELGVEFNGLQGDLPLFTDPKTGGTFSVSQGESLGSRLQEVRKSFEVPRVEIPVKAPLETSAVEAQLLLAKGDRPYKTTAWANRAAKSAGLKEGEFEVVPVREGFGVKKLSKTLKVSKTGMATEYQSVVNDIESYTKRNPDKDLWYHGGDMPDSRILESGYFTKSISDAIDYAKGSDRTGGKGEAFVYVVDRNKVKLGGDVENPYLLEPAKYERVFDINKVSKDLVPAVKVDGKVYTADMSGGLHDMVWKGIYKDTIKNAKSTESGWAKADGTGFTKSRPITDTISDINTAFGERGAIGKKELTSEQIAARERLQQDVEGIKLLAEKAGKNVYDFLRERGLSEDTIAKITPMLGAEIDKPLSKTQYAKETLREEWNRIAAIPEHLKGKSKLTYKGVEEQVVEPEVIMRRTEGTKKVWDELANADSSKNQFEYTHLKKFYEAIKGIKPESIASTRVGRALDAKINPDALSPSGRKAYDFIKKDFDFVLAEFARKRAGSEEVYQRILKEVNSQKEGKWKVSDLDKATLGKYNDLKAGLAEIRKGRKISDMSKEELAIYNDIRQQMRDKLSADFRKRLPENEAEVYDVLSKRIEDYLPRLFEQGDLVVMLRKDLADFKEALSKATNKSVITKYKNKIAQLEKSISKVNGGEWINYSELPSEIRFRFFETRRGKSGYSYDALKAYEVYIRGLAKKMFDEPALKEIKKSFKDIDPEYKQYTKELVEHYMDWDKSKLDWAAGAITSFEWMRTLGGNPRSAITNLTQRINTLAVAPKYAVKAQGMLLSSKKATRAAAQKLFDESGIAQEVTGVLSEGPTPQGLQYAKALTGAMFNRIEYGNRFHAYITGYLRGKDVGAAKGLKGAELEAFAKKEGLDLVHQTQFRYGKLGIPKAMWKPAGRIAFQFSSYPIKQARFLMDLYKKDPAAFVRYILFAEGLKLTLNELADTDLSNALGFGMSWGEAFNTVKFLADGDVRGAIRHGRQVLDTGGGLLPSGLGPAATGVLNVVSAIGKGEGVEQLGKELTPVVARRLEQFYDAINNKQGDKYPIFDYNGDLMYRLTLRQLLQRTLGPRTAKEHTKSGEYEAGTLLEQERLQLREDVRDKLIKGDKEGAKKLTKKYGEFPTPNAITNKLLRRKFTREELRKPGPRELYQLNREGRTY